MDIELLRAGPCTWQIMVRWPGRVRYRRVGTLRRIGWRWEASEGDDFVEGSKKKAALDDFMDEFVVGCCSSLHTPA